MSRITNALVNFFGVIIRGQTYLNMIYLFLAFPLGLVYFIFLVTGISLGLPLIIIWVGLPILAVVFAMWYGFIVLERQMAISLLQENIPTIQKADAKSQSLFDKFIAAVKNPVTWKGLVFLFSKLLLGIISFSVLVTFLSLSLGLITAPFYYRWFNPEINLTMNGLIYYPFWTIDTLGEALIASLIGVLILLVSMHLFNGLAWLSGKYARVMLGNLSVESAAPSSLSRLESDISAPVDDSTALVSTTQTAA